MTDYQMNAASALGTLGTLIGLVRAVPQLVTLLRTRKSHGVSVDTAATSSALSFGWATYGVLTGQPYVSLATSSSGCVFAAITVFALRFGRAVREFKIAPLWLVVLLVVGSIGGAKWLGLLLPVSVLAANLPQIWVAYREWNLAELSAGTWLLSTADGLVWGAYSLVQSDASILVFACFQATTSATIVALKLAHSWAERRSPITSDTIDEESP